MVAHGIDGAEFGMRLFAKPFWVEVTASRKHQSVKAFQCIDNDLLIIHGRNDNRYSTGFYYLLVVCIPQCHVYVTVVASKSNKRFHYQSSVCIGTSRFMDWSSEMRVSVDTTPSIDCNVSLSSFINCSLSRT